MYPILKKKLAMLSSNLLFFLLVAVVEVIALNLLVVISVAPIIFLDVVVAIVLDDPVVLTFFGDVVVDVFAELTCLNVFCFCWYFRCRCSIFSVEIVVKDIVVDNFSMRAFVGRIRCRQCWF